MKAEIKTLGEFQIIQPVPDKSLKYEYELLQSRYDKLKFDHENLKKKYDICQREKDIIMK